MASESEDPSFRPKHVARAAGWLIVAQTLSLCLKLALVPVLTRLLEPAEYGVVSVCMALVLLVTTIGGQGGWSAALVVTFRTNIDVWRSAYTMTLILGAVLSLIILLLAEPLAQLIGMADHVVFLQVISLLLPFMLGTELLSTYLLCNDLFRADAKIGLTAEIIAAGCAIAAAFMGLGAWSLVLQQAMAYGIRFALLSLVSRLSPTPRPLVSEVWKLTPYALKSTAAEVVNFAGVQGPLIIVGRMLGPSGGGLYNVAGRISSLPGDIVMQSLARILVPALAGLKGKERAKAVIWSGTANSIAIVPALFGAAALADPLCRVLLGPTFFGAAPLLIGLAIGKAIGAPCAGFYSYLKAANRVGLLWTLMGARSAFIVIGTVLGTNIGGLAGAGLGYAAAMFPTLVIFCAVVFRLANIRWFEGIKVYLIIVLCALIMASIVSFGAAWAEGRSWSDWKVLGVGTAIGGLIYCMLITTIYRRQAIDFLRARRLQGRPVTSFSDQNWIE